MTPTTRIRHRATWMVASVVLLLLALALAACGGRGAQAGNNAANGGYGNTTSTQQTGGGNDSATQVINADSDLQAISAALDGAQNDANQDWSAQDTEVQP